MKYEWFSFQDDFVVSHKRKEQLEKYDNFFKKFEHSKALDAALDVRLLFSMLLLFYAIFEFVKFG